ncbi:MAG: energy-coupling factor transporter transmembrane protein EcfT [Clostridiales bacterium]|nr:energy-coupling factor transporter transmembrane protein EcfT [Clostridiales bacterium]
MRKTVKPGDKFCGNCGNKIVNKVPESTKTNDQSSAQFPLKEQNSNNSHEKLDKNKEVLSHQEDYSNLQNKKKRRLKWLITLAVIILMFIFRNKFQDIYLVLLLGTGLWILLGLLNPKWAMLGKTVSRLKVLRNGVLASLLFVIMIVTAVTPSTPVSDLHSSSDTENITDTVQNNTIIPSYKYQKYSSNGIEITLPPGAVNTAEKLDIKNSSKAPQTNQGITNVVKSYEIKLGNVHRFDGDLKINIPYDRSKLKSSDPEKSLEAVYYNEKTSSWDQVRTAIHKDKISLYMDHLTVVSVVESDRAKPRQISAIGSANKELLNEAEKIGKMDAGSASKKLEMIGWSQALNAYGGLGSSTTLMEEVLEFSKLTGANDIMKNLGVATTVIQIMAEVSDGKYDTASQTGTKGFLSYAIAQWGSSALNVAGVGMFIIDYSLNTFAEEAEQLRV